MLLLLVVVFGIVLRLWTANTEHRQSPDTFEYARQTSALLTGGIGFLRSEAARFASDPAMARIPSPARSLWLLVLAGWSRLTNTTGLAPIVSFACFADMLTLGLLAFVSAEILGTAAAVAATLLYAVSPAALSIARHGWGESFTGLLCLLNLLFAHRLFARPASRWPVYALGLLGGLTFAVKETAFLQSTIVVVLVMALLFVRKRRHTALTLGSTFAAALLVTLAGNAYVLGGLSNALRLTGVGRDAHGLVTYATAYQSGSPAQWIGALFLTDPVVFTAGLAGLFVVVTRFRRVLADHPVLLLCVGICFTFVLLPALGRNLYNVRWISPAYTPECILAAFALHTAWQRITAQRPAAVHRWLPFAICTLALCAGIGIWRYDSLIAAPDLQDLSLKMVLTGRN